MDDRTLELNANNIIILLFLNTYTETPFLRSQNSYVCLRLIFADQFRFITFLFNLHSYIKFDSIRDI